MENFIYTPGSILLATTMIEVGIDIPTATLIGIYAAEHFGLSQLHQLRGRVGRSDLQSTCYLISEKEDVEMRMENQIPEKEKKLETHFIYLILDLFNLIFIF